MTLQSAEGRTRIVATAGHVDHGKSTLVRALTGTDPDRWAEEKERGLTIDLGFAWTELPSGVTLSFVDVPGHVRFLPNMLAGVGAVAGCLLAVAATEGWMPQSEEHLRILDVLGTAAGVVALTKVAGLDRETLELAELELRERLEGTFLERAPIIQVDAPAGLGIVELRAALEAMAAGTPDPPDSGRPRLWVDRSFSAAGAGTVVTGTLTGGAVSVGDPLIFLPAGSASATARIRGIQTHGRDVDAVGPGNRVALNLAGPTRADVQRGQALVRPGQWEPSVRFDAGLRVLPGLDHPVTRRGSFALHVGSHAARVDLQLLGGKDRLLPGESGAARLRLAAGTQLALAPGDRFVLRESGRDETVAGGEVLDVAPVLRPARARPDRDVDRVVEERGWVDSDLLYRLTGERRSPTVGNWVVSPRAHAEAETAIRNAVEASGPLGLELAALDERQRALVAAMDGVELVADRVVLSGANRISPEAAAWVKDLADQPFSPPPPNGLAPAVVRDLVKRSGVIEADGLFFHPSAVERAGRVVAGLLSKKPTGVTVAEVRQALETSRKWAMPLLAHLDATGVTRRRGDVRIAGPRLPGAEETA